MDDAATRRQVKVSRFREEKELKRKLEVRYKAGKKIMSLLATDAVVSVSLPKPEAFAG